MVSDPSAELEDILLFLIAKSIGKETGFHTHKKRQWRNEGLAPMQQNKTKLGLRGRNIKVLHKRNISKNLDDKFDLLTPLDLYIQDKKIILFS